MPVDNTIGDTVQSQRNGHPFTESIAGAGLKRMKGFYPKAVVDERKKRGKSLVVKV